jgi:DNA-binding NarL/FixJ family response regulator
MVVSSDGVAAQGLARLLEFDGVAVTVSTRGVSALREDLGAMRPDVAVIDGEMPDPFDRDAIDAVFAYRQARADCGLVVVGASRQTVTSTVIAAGASVGLIDRDLAVQRRRLATLVRLVAAGGVAVDRVRAVAQPSELAALTRREREVLELMAQGNSNIGIAEQLVISVPAVERNVTRIFDKLQLERGPLHHARVRAVLALLREQSR